MLVADKHRDDRRRRFISAETMIVARGRRGDSQKILMLIYRLNDRAHEQKERHVARRILAGIQKVLARIGRKRPVVVLAASVYAVKRLFMQKTRRARASSRASASAPS